MDYLICWPSFFLFSLVSESESIGMSTLTQMSMQREQMQIASDNMNATVNLTAQARQILKKMWVEHIIVCDSHREMFETHLYYFCRFLFCNGSGATRFSKTSWHFIAWLFSSFSWIFLSFVQFGRSTITAKEDGDWLLWGIWRSNDDCVCSKSSRNIIHRKMRVALPAPDTVCIVYTYMLTGCRAVIHTWSTMMTRSQLRLAWRHRHSATHHDSGVMGTVWPFLSQMIPSKILLEPKCCPMLSKSRVSRSSISGMRRSYCRKRMWGYCHFVCWLSKSGNYLPRHGLGDTGVNHKELTILTSIAMSLSKKVMQASI